MRRNSKQERTTNFYQSMSRLGFDFDTANKLRLIEKTLHSWAELECGNSNEYGSWAIERDETTDKPFIVHHHYRHGQGKDSVSRTAIADREAGALRRLSKIMESFPGLVYYHQTDPRGCALYIVKKADLGELPIDSVYTRGFGVCID